MFVNCLNFSQAICQKTFWPLHVITHSRRRTAFSICSAVLQHRKSKKEIHFRATWKFFTVLISILKMWEMNQNKGVTTPNHNVHKIIIQLFHPNAGIDFPPLSFIFIAVMNINKSQVNYFSTVSQCFSYLAGTAVTHPNAFIYIVYGQKY